MILTFRLGKDLLQDVFPMLHPAENAVEKIYGFNKVVPWN